MQWTCGSVVIKDSNFCGMQPVGMFISLLCVRVMIVSGPLNHLLFLLIWPKNDAWTCVAPAHATTRSGRRLNVGYMLKVESHASECSLKACPARSRSRPMFSILFLSNVSAACRESSRRRGRHTGGGWRRAGQRLR